jgi:hypothetical protein
MLLENRLAEWVDLAEQVIDIVSSENVVQGVCRATYPRK